MEFKMNSCKKVLMKKIKNYSLKDEKRQKEIR
jgi:hypothetical protein